MMITQYYPNPLFRKSGAKHVQSGNGTMAYETGSANRFLILTPADDTGMQCSLNLTGLPAAGTRMVFSIGTFIPSGATKFRNGCLAVFGLAGGGWTEVAKVGLRPVGHVRQSQAHDQGRLGPVPGHGGPAGVRVLGSHAPAALTVPVSEGRRA